MNSDQQLVGWMVVILIAIVCMTVYRKYITAVLFTPTAKGITPGGGPGSLWNPYGIVSPFFTSASQPAPTLPPEWQTSGTVVMA